MNRSILILLGFAFAGVALGWWLTPRPDTPVFWPDRSVTPPAPIPATRPSAPVEGALPNASVDPSIAALPEPPDVPMPDWPVIEVPAPPARIYTLQERLDEITPAALPRLVEKFEAARVSWPPSEVTLVALKDQNIVEMYARGGKKRWSLVHRYPVLKASGTAGPKLQFGDKQVPEGIYKIEYLNPNSRFHVSMKLDYPNAFDREMGAKDKRADLGGDIMIHGKAASVGCLAMGDEAAEELFVLAATINIKNVTAIIAPYDFRASPPVTTKEQPPWLSKLYAQIASELGEFRAPTLATTP